MSSVSCNLKDNEPGGITETTPPVSQTVNNGVVDTGPVSGGTLQLFLIDPDTFNPLCTQNSNTNDILSCIYESLVKTGSDLHAIPWLASSWSVSDDRLVWTFELRDGIYWQDNVPLTTEDVEYSFNMIKGFGLKSPYFANLENIKSLTAIDGHHLKLILDQPDSFTPELMDFPILPAHLPALKDVSLGDFGKLIGSGPFKAVSYVKGGNMVLKRNDQWWASSEIYNLGDQLPYLDGIQLKPGTGSNTSVGSFQTREIDVAFLSREESGRFTGRTDITSSTYPSNEFEYVALNTNGTILKDIVIRQVIAQLIDRNAIVEGLFPGKAITAEFPILPGNWLEKGEIDDSSVSDLTTLKKLLESDGWRLTNERLYKKVDNNTIQLTLHLLVNNENEDRKRIAAYISTALLKCGINVIIDGYDWDKYLSVMSSGKYDLVLAGCRVKNIPDMSFMYASTSTDSMTSGNNTVWNIAGYKNPDVDTDLKSILSSTSDEDRISYFNSIKALVRNDVPYIGLLFYNNTALYIKIVRGIMEPSIWYKYNDIARWYLTGS